MDTTGGRNMSRQVFVVARDQVDLYDYLREEFAAANIEIVLDRRPRRDRRSAGDGVGGSRHRDARDRRSAGRRIRAGADARPGSPGPPLLDPPYAPAPNPGRPLPQATRTQRAWTRGR